MRVARSKHLSLIKKIVLEGRLKFIQHSSLRKSICPVTLMKKFKIHPVRFLAKEFARFIWNKKSGVTAPSVCCFPASCWGLHIISNISHHYIAIYIQAAVWNLIDMQLSWSIVNISALARWVCVNKTKLLGCQSWFLFTNVCTVSWVVYKSNRLVRRSTHLPAACFPKNPVAPATAWKRSFRGSRLECKRGRRCCWLSSWLVGRKCCHQRVTHNVSWGPGLLRGIKRDRHREKVGALRGEARCPISRRIFSPTWLFTLRN